MSADHWLEIETGAGHKAEVAEFNITYNCTPQLRLCGYPMHKDITGKRAGDLIPMFEWALAYSLDKENFVELSRLNPKNGWGDLQGVQEYLKEFRDACIKHPDTTVGSWL